MIAPVPVHCFSITSDNLHCEKDKFSDTQVFLQRIFKVSSKSFYLMQFATVFTPLTRFTSLQVYYITPRFTTYGKQQENMMIQSKHIYNGSSNVSQCILIY